MVHGAFWRSTHMITASSWMLGASLIAEETPIPRAVPVDPEATEATPVQPPPDAMPHIDFVTSESGQFRVRGGDGMLRGSVAILAEQTRQDFLHLTGEAGANRDFDVPVFITLVGKPGDAIPPRTISQSITFDNGQYHFRIHVHVGRGLDIERFEHAVTAALIYERTLANHAENDSETPLLVGPWLVEGLREAHRWRTGAGNRRLYEALFERGGIFTSDELFGMAEANHERLDGATRTAFQVSSGALVMALLEQPDGREAFRNFLAEVAKFAGEMPSLLRLHFPDLNLSENSLEKWWTLQLAAKGAAQLTESLGIVETESHLNDALRLRFRDAEGEMRELPIEQWAGLTDLDEAERADAVRMAEDALARLSYRCFPTYRPLLVSYLATLNRIAREPNRADAIDTQIAELAETRANMANMAGMARDYMDWFEITRARETSGAFDDYLRLQEQLREQHTATRDDGMSRMLDRFDAIFHRPGNHARGRLDGGWSHNHHPNPW